MTTLDGVERTLTAEDLLVCDAERRPQAIAGIMGGADAEVHDDTTEILLEAAYFQPMGISRVVEAARAAVRVERALRARHRSERCADRFAARAPSCCAQVAAGARRARADRRSTRRRSRRPGSRCAPPRVEALLGVELGADAGEGRAAAARDRDRGAATATSSSRSRRRSVPTSSARSTSSRRWPAGSGSTRSRARCPHTTGVGRRPHARASASAGWSPTCWSALGASEAMTVPLIAAADLERFGLSDRRDRRGDERAAGRGAVPAPGDPARAAQGGGVQRRPGPRRSRALRARPRVRARRPSEQLLPDERDHLAVAAHRRRCRAARSSRTGRSTSTTRSTLLDALAEALELADLAAGGRRPRRASIRRAAPPITVDGATIGHVGALAPTVLDAFGVPSRRVALELDIDGLLGGARRDRAFRPPSRFPASQHRPRVRAARDRARPPPSSGRCATALGDAARGGRACFDEFRADVARRRAGAASRSRCGFRAPDRTLTDAEIAELRQRGASTRSSPAHDAELRG